MNKTNDFKYNLPAYSDPVDIEDLNDNFRGIDDALMAGLCKKDYTGNNMGSSDPSARKYAWAPWLEIVNDNEFDVVVTDRNAPVGSEEATINIAAGQTFRKYINGRYYMNFYVQDQHDVTFKWFTNAETYINESGGGGGGTGTVTSVSVQGGSGSHLTASGNPIETSGTITIDIDDGYSIPSDNEQTAWDGKAADLKAEIDSSTYVLTLQLKDSAGNLIGTAKTIDLPLETMVVNGEYDSQTQKIKLELKNGNYVEFSVADLVSGLQTELSASNKLDPDYIDYDSSHRAVSDTEKDTWNSKQNAISDLATIRSGAAAGATAVQPSAMQTALATKQDSLSETQLAAVNSGINSTKVAQIETNKTNILYVSNCTGKNYYNIKNENSVFANTDTVTIQSGTKSVTATVNADGSVTLTGATEGTTPTFILETGDLSRYAGMYLSGAYSDKVFIQMEQRAAPYDIYAKDTGSGAQIASSMPTLCNFFIRLSSNFTIPGSITLKPMICDVDAKNIDPSYQPYALPNYDLTRLESEDRAGLIECVDGGAKNLLQYQNASWNSNLQRLKDINPNDSSRSWSGNVCTFNGVSYTVNSDGTISTSGTASSSESSYFTLIDFGSGLATSAYAGNVLSGCPTEGNYSTKYSLYVVKADGNTLSADEGNSVVIGNDAIRWVRIIARNSTNMNGKVFKPMICTKAAFGVSQKFVPYCKFSKIVANITKTITTSATLDFAGLTYNVPADVNRYLRVTAWAKASGKNPETIAIATTTGAILGYSAFPTDTTNSCISTSCIINTGSNATIDLKVKYNGVGSNHTVGMIVEEL